MSISNNKPVGKTKRTANPHRKKRLRWILLSIVIVLIAFRLWLPYLVLKIVNKKLTEIDGYTGHVRDIDLHLIVGSYLIKDIELKKTGGQIPVPFFSADVINLSVEWKALFQGGIVGEIEVTNPVLNFVKGPTPATSQTKIDKDWTKVVDELMPIKINRFEITNGKIYYRDYYSTPNVNVFLDNLHIVAENLSNAKDNKELLPSTATATANVYGGKATLNMKLDALNKVPTFDMNTELKGLDLTKINDFIKAYANFDVQKGTFSVYAEAAAKNGKISGYTKPIIKDLDVVGPQDKTDTFGQKLWENLVGFGAWIFSNPSKDQVATRVDFEGDLKNPDISIWDVIAETLRNAFVKALYPSLENTVNIGTVGTQTTPEKKGLLKKIFNKDGEKKDKKNK